jgi:hypothetical protein
VDPKYTESPETEAGSGNAAEDVGAGIENVPNADAMLPGATGAV